MRKLRLGVAGISGATVVSLLGALDQDAADAIAGLGPVAELAPRLVVDLSRVTLIDIDGLRLIEQLAGTPRMSVQNLSPAVARLLELLGRTEI